MQMHGHGLSLVRHKEPITGSALLAMHGNVHERFRPLLVMGFLFIKIIWELLITMPYGLQ